MVAGPARGGGDGAPLITAAAALSPEQLDAIAALETRVIAHDGGRLKLEWQVLRARAAGETRDFLCWSADGTRLLGFAGTYGFGGGPPELAGMVDPDARRRGIATALLDAAAVACAARREPVLLLVVPRNGAGGGEFAQRHGGRLAHSEHAMLLRGEPAPAPRHEDLTVRPGTPADIPRLTEILTEAFGYSVPADHSTEFETERLRRLVIERQGEVIGGLRAALDGGRGSVYGFAVAPAQRGRGVGRDVLARVCLDLRARGAREVALEVLSDNDRALGLYESLGFERVITEDYFELKV